MDFMFVGLGGFIGAILRYYISNVIPHSNFPLPTFLINVTGSFIIGFVLLLSYERLSATPQFRLFFAVGVLGSFTTFSTYGVETLKLINKGQISIALTYYIISIIAGVIAVELGTLTAKSTLYYFGRKDEKSELDEGEQN